MSIIINKLCDFIIYHHQHKCFSARIRYKFCFYIGKRSNGDTSGVQKKARLNLVGNNRGFVKIGDSFKNTIAWYYRKNTENIFSYSPFLQSIKSEIMSILQSSNLPIKFNLKLEATYNTPHVENSSVNRAFKTSARSIFEDTIIEEVVDEMCTILLAEEDGYQGKDSGFTLESIDGILLAVYKYTPLGGSSYIQLPNDIECKKACINPQSSDHQCFKWAILAKHVTGGNRHRVGDNYTRHDEKYNYTGLTFPTPLAEIKLFEKNNPDVSINVYGLKQRKDQKKVVHNVYPLKVVSEEKSDHFDLLLITDGDKSHYVYISNFSRLVRSQKTGHDGRIYICKRCFTSFNNQPRKFKLHGQDALEEHLKICGTHKPILPQMPPPGTMLEFEAWSKTQRHPIAIYADFEALLVKCEENKGSNTRVLQEHKPMSYGLSVVASKDVPSILLEKFDIPQKVVIHRGSKSQEGVAKHFVESIVTIAEKIEKLLKTNTPLIMTEEEKRSHIIKKTCNLCGKGFTIDNHKVADHNHLSGRFRQTLCNTCNLKLQTPVFVPCFIHNLSSYDAHFIVTELGYDSNSIRVIPNTEEKYISFTKYISNKFSIRFLDTFRFMASSLATLASNLITAEFEKFRETSKEFPSIDLPLVTRKGGYIFF
jgi:hypothetical protein